MIVKPQKKPRLKPNYSSAILTSRRRVIREIHLEGLDLCVQIFKSTSLFLLRSLLLGSCLKIEGCLEDPPGNIRPNLLISMQPQRSAPLQGTTL